MTTKVQSYVISVIATLSACGRSTQHALAASPAGLCYRLAAAPSQPEILIPGGVRLTDKHATSHFSNLKGRVAQPLDPDTMPSLASLLWLSTSDSLTLVYDHYFVHVEARLARLGDSLAGTATYSSDVRGGADPHWIVSGHRTPC